MTARYLVGDVFDRLAELEDGSVDLVVTSPPFLALRSYLPADHPDKGKEIGSEATPAAFLDVMLAVMAELRRVTAVHGSVCIELGDTYAGSGGAGGDYDDDGLREGQPRYKASDARKEVRLVMADGRTIQSAGISNGLPRKGQGWPLAKSKALIPELFRIALAYGINPLTGAESPAGKWLIRNVVTWCRPNPPVGALGDKWRPATSDVVVACTSPKRYWDDLATRRPHKEPWRSNGQLESRGREDRQNDAGDVNNWLSGVMPREYNASGAPLLDYWEIPPTGYSGAHYAVYPPALVEPLVKAMCPSKVCQVCGQPSRRIVETAYEPHSPETIEAQHQMAHGKAALGTRILGVDETFRYGRASRVDETVGWTDCGHDDYRPGIVLDPFAGSGTTLQVATGHGMDAIGIDLDERNAVLAEQRIGGLFLEVER